MKNKKIEVLEVKEEVEPELLKIEGVTGIGIARKSPERIRVYIEELTTKIERSVPKEIKGIPVELVKTGKITALTVLEKPVILKMSTDVLPLAEQLARTDIMRPVRPGCSIGNIEITAGTLGCIVVDKDTGLNVILSNAHVLTPDPRLTDFPTEKRVIVQPGVFDGGTIENHIANLLRNIPISETEENLVDCALAMPLSQDLISDDIIDIGKITAVTDPVEYMQVKKSGRTTSVTTGIIRDINATIKVGYGTFEATFRDQIVTDAMANPGDSGSLLLDMDNRAVGLLFAGSEFVTIHNKIANVINALNINIAGYEVPPTPPARPPVAAAGSILLLGTGLMSIPGMKFK
jgi:hypothetical protein